MASDLANPKTWVQYHTKDCSQDVCTASCTQGCNNRFFLSPPTPPISPFSSSSSPSPGLGVITFSPLVIAIVGILASAFLLVSYYAIITTYCGNTSSTSSTTRTRRRRRRSSMINFEFVDEENGDDNISYHRSSRAEPWYSNNNARNSGLDEAVIKTFTTLKVGEGFVNKGSGDKEEEYCCVCLGEFELGESLRLLPKCDHAFHVVCIDTWLKSHSNCPLCRAGIVSTSSTCTSNNDNAAPMTAEADQLAPEATIIVVVPPVPDDGDDQPTRNLELVAASLSTEEGVRDQPVGSRNTAHETTDTVVVITDEEDETGSTSCVADYSVRRRSFSMDHATSGFSVGEEDEEEEECCELHTSSEDMIGSSSLLQPQGEISSTGSVSTTSKILMSCSASIKRTFSSGRFSFPCCTCTNTTSSTNSVVPL